MTHGTFPCPSRIRCSMAALCKVDTFLMNETYCLKTSCLERSAIRQQPGGLFLFLWQYAVHHRRKPKFRVQDSSPSTRDWSVRPSVRPFVATSPTPSLPRI